MDRDSFIKLAVEKYGDAFNYSHIPEFIKRRPETIICNKHGKYKMIPRDHLRSRHGCPRCATEAVLKPSATTNAELLAKAIAKYGDHFDYSLVDISVDRGTKVRIRCNEHGEFKTTLKAHLNSEYGCFKCGYKVSLKQRTQYKTLDDVILASARKHGTCYHYTNYNQQDRVVTYVCKKHGEVVQLLRMHLSGRGCPDCGQDGRTITPEEFMKRAKRVHPIGYRYNLSDLKTTNHKIEITHQCGHSYFGRVSNHLAGQGCISCKSSLGERKIKDFLIKHKIPHICQFKFDGYLYRYDFCLPDLKILIEYDGEQHFRPVKYFGGEAGFARRQLNDQDKNMLASIFKYQLIRIPYTEFCNLEIFLSRAIDRYFNYRVNGVFYKTFVELCTALKYPPTTKVSEVVQYTTINSLSATN